MSIEQGTLSSVGFVNVGLFCQAVVNELFAIEDSKGRLPPHPASLKVAVESLKFIEGEQVADPSSVAFKSYEALVILSGTGSTQSVGDVKELLACIVDDTTPAPTRLTKTEQAIDIFTKFSSRALMNVRSPEDRMPEGVSKLVANRG